MIHIISYGRKYGAPDNLDFAFKVCRLRNPYADITLRPCNGLDIDVMEYVMRDPMFIMLTTNIALAIKQYWQTIADDFTVGIYCTGGKHRSVVVSEALYAYFNANNYSVSIAHRDIDKE